MATAGKGGAAPMSRGDIVDEVAAQCNLSKVQADQVVRAVEAAIKRALGNGSEVRLSDFGTFKVSHRAARQGRNPRTGEPTPIAASSIPTFRASSSFKSALSGGKGNKGSKGGKGSKKK